MEVCNRAPNVFLLGAAKSGTTSVFKYLDQHKDVYFPFAKEPQFFSNDAEYAKGLEYYLDKYYQGAERYKIRCDATPHYIYYEKSAQRLAETTLGTNTKFIVILRDPVKRAYSLYWNMISEGYEDLPFDQALEMEPTRIKSHEAEALGSVRYQYFNSGLYAQQLEHYFKYFEREDFLILFQEDLAAKPQQVMDSVFEFIGLEKIAVDTEKTFNRSGVTRSKTLQGILRGDNWLKRTMGRLISPRIKFLIVEKLLSFNKKDASYEKIDPEVEQKLRRRFEQDVTRLEGLTGRDLSSWKL